MHSVRVVVWKKERVGKRVRPVSIESRRKRPVRRGLRFFLFEILYVRDFARLHLPFLTLLTLASPISLFILPSVGCTTFGILYSVFVPPVSLINPKNLPE